MIAESLQKVEAGSDLSADEAEEVMGELLEGHLEQMQIVGLLTSLRAKGEAVEELVGFARAMRRRVDHPGAQAQISPLVDTCGTGGDGGGTFNVSTAAALVVAGAGVRVAKHGNRSFSSRCGSADVLEALDVRIDIAPQRALAAIDQIGIGFLFAPSMHTAMRHAAAARREAGGRTVFNLLGPLTNPAGATAQVIGVFDPAFTELLALALRNLGSRRAFVVHGLDELATLGRTRVTELRDGAIHTYELTPDEVGLPTATADDLRPGDGPQS